MRSASQPRTRQHGFSLIELLIALALGTVVTVGIIQLFVGNNETYALLTGQSRMQENARFALDFLARSARSAGHLGCDPDPDKMISALNGDFDQLFEFNINAEVEGFEGGDPGDGWAPSLTNLPRTEGGASFNTHIDGNGIDTTTIEPGTDVLVLRQVRAPGDPLAQVAQPNEAPVIMAPGGQTDIGALDIVVISDCERGAMFKVQSTSVAGNNVTLNVATGAGLYENRAPFTISEGASFGNDATVGLVETTIFYIAPGTGQNNRGNTPLSLWRKVSDRAPVELIEGIEDLEVLYGIDTTLSDGIANANQYVTANNIPSFDQVVTIRMTITANSVNVVTDEGDGLLRRSFSQTVLMRNANPG